MERELTLLREELVAAHCTIAEQRRIIEGMDAAAKTIADELREVMTALDGIAPGLGFHTIGEKLAQMSAREDAQ